MLLTLETFDRESNDSIIADLRKALTRSSSFEYSPELCRHLYTLQSFYRNLHQLLVSRDLLGNLEMHTLPPAPGPWAGAETMQRWLQAKVEEDRRCQEEEKTRQETMKLERRKVDHAILVDALRAGVPPHLAPLVFGAIDGPVDGKPATPEMLQYMADMNRNLSAQTHQPQTHPEATHPTLPSLSQQFSTQSASEPLRDIHTIPTNAYVSLAQTQSSGVRNSSSQLSVGAGSSNGGGRAPFVSTAIASNTASAGNISRPMELTTQSRSTSAFHLVHSLGAPAPPSNPPRSQQESRARRPSPSIAFHHWIPPGQSQSTRIQEDHMIPSNGSAQVRPEIQGSPERKRKSLSIHQQLLPPSSRSSGASEVNSRYGRHSPGGSNSGQTSVQGDSRRPSDVSSPRENPSTEKGHTENIQNADRLRLPANLFTEYDSHDSRRRSTGDNAEREDSDRGPDRESQRQYPSRGSVSDAEDTPDHQPDAKHGTRSSAMTGWGDRD